MAENATTHVKTGQEFASASSKNSNRSVLLREKVLIAVESYLRKGLSLAPCDPLTKKPFMKWKQLQEKPLSPEQAKKLEWPGIAVICGKVSGNLECLDFDFKAAWFDDWKALVKNEEADLLDRFLIQNTQSGGKHIVYRSTEPIPGNQKLATDVMQVEFSETYEKSNKRFFNFQGKELEVHEVDGKLFIYPCYIETRGEGGYFLAAVTNGYIVTQGNFLDLPVISAQERAILINSAKALNRKFPDPERIFYKSNNGDRRPGDLYNERADIRPLLSEYGWKPAGTRGEVEHYTRPGKSRGISANLFDGKIFHVFSTNAAPFEGNKSYQPFSVYALLEHGGDYEAAARDLASRGYSEPKQSGERVTDLADEKKKKSDKKPQAEMLLKIAKGLQFYHDPEGTVYANLPVRGHFEFVPINSRFFKDWLSNKFYNQTGSIATSEALAAALRVLNGQGRYYSPEVTTYVRLAVHKGAIYLDLCNPQREVVKIDKKGWRVVSDYPVFFRRPKGCLALPTPKPGGSILDLKKYLNVRDESSFRLIVAWMLQALKPDGPYPVLVIIGEQGTAKSTSSKLLRNIIDPNLAPLRSLPRSERDLVISCSNSWIQVLENISYIPDWLSDALCRLSTGGGFSTRTLYEDAEETLFASKRPIILNGISNFVTRHDLADRALVVHLDPIPDDKRLPESQLISKFEKSAPCILGAFLDAVSEALKNIETTKLARLPRMADFALWVSAAELALPWEPGGFMKTYDAKRAETVKEAIESSTVGTAVLKLMDNRDLWEGSPGELLTELESLTDERTKKSKRWPANARWMNARLTETASFLRKIGVEIFQTRSSSKRTIKIMKNSVTCVTNAIDDEKQYVAGDDNDDATDLIKNNFTNSVTHNIQEIQSIVSNDANDGKKHTLLRPLPVRGEI